MKRPTLHYLCLAIVFAASVVFQVARSYYLLPGWFNKTHAIQEPFVITPTPEGFKIGWASPWALKAGVEPGQVLKSVDGKAVRGSAVYGQAIVNALPGQTLQLTVQPQRDGKLLPEKSISLPMPRSERTEGSSEALSLLYFVLIPLFCIALGFWVAAVRIRDPLAWLLLALMLSFATATYPSPELWRPLWRDYGAAYYAGLLGTWPIWMLLFGIYFPEPFQQQSWRKRWRLAQWVVVIPLAVLALIRVITSLGAMRDYLSVSSLLSIEISLSPLESALMVASVIGFFACIGLKLRLAGSRDARRRLRLLFAGTIISLVPMGSLITISLLRGWVLGSHFPDGLWLGAFSMAFLFPLTLAYVIVVERAMDVRVVIRQGLRYAFAKSGVNAIQIGFGAGSIAVVILILKRVRPYSTIFFVIIAAVVLVFLGTRQGFRKLRLWIDRKFFRDAYNAEQILSELGDQMRSIVEPRPLLEKVCGSIADSLHVPRVAALLQDQGSFKPAYALGYDGAPDVTFTEHASALERMRRVNEPLTVYFDDPESWIYQSRVSPLERAELEALHAQLLLPLAANERLLGFLSLAEKRSEEPYSRSDIRLLKSVASQTGLALENAQLSAALAREAAQRERRNRELEIAREVQERLFPQKLPLIAGLDYRGVCRPAFGVGGDSYDFLLLPEGRLGIAVADVSGKGIVSALMMASLHAWLRGESLRADSNPSHLVGRVSRLLFEASDSNRYATLFYAQYDPSAGRLEYVNAGHNPPVLLRRRGDRLDFERLSEGGTVVGLFEQAAYCQGSVALDEGSLLVAFTDGITEAMNAEGEEWGEHRLIETIRTTDGLQAGDMIRRILASVDAFTAGAEQHDDMTLVVVRAGGGLSVNTNVPVEM
ncbi:MAG TPA: SpoIIE family protein phosphatase [Terriglobia bacterium]|nr:SpoIIE family protein phosphatase [Terriglobia bacterium]